MIKAANGPLKGMLGVNAKPLVSTDFNHDPLSSIFDLDRHARGRRHLLPRRRLVRQRMGLLQPHERHGRRHGAAHVNDTKPAAERRTAGQVSTFPASGPSRGSTLAANACSSASISTCRSRTASSPTRPASSACCRPSCSCAQAGAKVIVLSHLGRPKGRAVGRHLAAADRAEDAGADAGHQGALHRRLRRRRAEARRSAR